ncbi:MAG: peptidoglycan-associated lipoprotein Pal [Gammaproteobacteria bacterium]|nr:peptidoglycan-associated lipoprotein Pal [Gammaproteobacteria bacterium]
MYNGLWKLLLLIAVLVPLTACETMGLKDEGEQGEAAVEERGTYAGTEGQEQADDASTRGMEEGTGFRGHPLDDPDSPLAKRVIYFDFDRSTVRADFRAVVEAHASYLAEQRGANVTLEGHADERGSREYNMGLGEQRANAVKRLMTMFGVDGGQIESVSYGEERPAEEGHDESAWQYNRRVEIIYLAR